MFVSVKWKVLLNEKIQCIDVFKLTVIDFFTPVGFHSENKPLSALFLPVLTPCQEQKD